MPYSSAMQCRKVASVYSENPRLIERYTASGAYLLSSCKNDDEREAIWLEARGEKPSPSIGELRETLKLFRERERSFLDSNSSKKRAKSTSEKFKISPMKIKKSLSSISTYCESFVACINKEEQNNMRIILADNIRLLLKKMEQKV